MYPWRAPSKERGHDLLQKHGPCCSWNEWRFWKKVQVFTGLSLFEIWLMYPKAQDILIRLLQVLQVFLAHLLAPELTLKFFGFGFFFHYMSPSWQILGSQLAVLLIRQLCLEPLFKTIPKVIIVFNLYLKIISMLHPISSASLGCILRQASQFLLFIVLYWQLFKGKRFQLLLLHSFCHQVICQTELAGTLWSQGNKFNMAQEKEFRIWSYFLLIAFALSHWNMRSCYQWHLYGLQ